MKLLHSGDLHLGRSFSNVNRHLAKLRREELWLALEKQVAYCLDKDISYLLLAGDVFEQDYTGYLDLERFASLVAPIPHVIVIKGNHDYQIQGLEGDNIFFIEDCDWVDFPQDNLRIFGLSWTGPKAPDLSLLRTLQVDPSQNNICLLHGDFSSKDFLQEQEFFSKMDYIALGHIHKGGKVTDKAYYAGSPEPFDFSEVGDHGFLQVELKPLQIEKISKAQRSYYKFDLEDDGTYPSQWIEKYHLKKDAFYQVTLKGTQILDLNGPLLEDFFAQRGYQLSILDERIQEELLENFKRREDLFGDVFRLLEESQDPIHQRAKELFIELCKDVL